MLVMGNEKWKMNYNYFRSVAKLIPKDESKLIRNCFHLLSQSEISKLKIVSLSQLLLAMLDFAGVLAIGLIGTLSVYGIQSKQPTGQLKSLLELVGLEDLKLQTQVAIVGILAAFTLVIKSVLSAYINRRTIFFLASRSADLSSRIIERLAFSNLEQIRKRSRVENIFAITTGVRSVTVGVIGTLVNLFADLLLILIMFIGLMFIDASIALLTVTLFGLIAWILYKLVNRRVNNLAKDEANFQIENDKLLFELLGSFREIFVSGTRRYYVDKVLGTQHKLSKVGAEISFIPMISKYVLEIAFVVGAVLFVGIQFLLKDAVGAVSSVSIFIAASGRVIPAILRLQGAAIRFRGSLIGAEKTLEVIEELKEFNQTMQLDVANLPNAGGKKVDLVSKDLHFEYRGSGKTVLKGVDFRIESGEWLAIVGPSGAGKSTLVDIILGIYKPTLGSVQIADLEPEVYIKAFPGKIAYVPQDTFILEGTLKQNIALGVEDVAIDEDRVIVCLEMVGLSEFTRSLKQGIESKLAELGSNISGGQRQRLAIARALYSDPILLILDEATSSLDSISEETVVRCLRNLRGKLTIISIAHRLSTVVSADRIMYLDNGGVLAIGSFDEVRKQVPNFEKQAKLSRIIN